MEDLEDPGVVDGLGCIQQEDEPLGAVSNALVEKAVEALDVGVATDAGQEAPLRRVEEARDGRHDGTSNRTGEDAVVGVGDTDRASVRDQTSLFIREQEEEAVIKKPGG
jgi:hypothetical protein